jgi:hypothetical protein
VTELDLAVFRGCRHSLAAQYHENFTSPCAGLRLESLRCRSECSKTVSGILNSPNILKERVLFTPSEFHSGLKRATTSGQGASVALAAARFAR